MITKVRARNFLSFEELDLELPRTTVLVGPNMSGKTNLLTVLRFLNLAMRPSGASQAFLDMGGMSEVAWKGSEKTEIELGISVETATGHGIHKFDYDFAFRGSFKSSQFIVTRESLYLEHGGARKGTTRDSIGKGAMVVREQDDAIKST
jgi:predicted ATPase